MMMFIVNQIVGRMSFLEYDYVGAPGEYLIITTHTEI
jgi:hypothetical protein